MKTLLVVALLALSGVVQAESSAAKKDLVAKLLKLQQPAIESMSRNMAESPAMQMSQQVGPILQTRVAPEKREAVAKEIQADIKRYVDEAVPIARERAIKLAQATIGPVLEEKMSEDELRQIVTYLESPAAKKYQQVLGGDLQKTLTEKLGAELRGPLEPKVKALEQSITKRLGIAPPPAAAAPAPAPAAAPAKTNGK